MNAPLTRGVGIAQLVFVAGCGSVGGIASHDDGGAAPQADGRAAPVSPAPDVVDSGPEEIVTGIARNRMDASARTTCWLSEHGEMSCNGALLRGTTSAEDGAFVKVSVGGDMACGLREDGTARCFLGQVACNLDKRCRIGALTSAAHFRSDLPGSYIDLDVEATGSAVLTLDEQGHPRRFFIDQSTGSIPSFVDILTESTAFVRIAGTDFQACGLQASGHVTCWENYEHAQRYEPEGRFVALAAGSSHLCVLSTEKEGSIVCWGGDDAWQAANASGHFTAVSAGDSGTCALLEGGAAQCWGDGSPDPGPVPEGTFVAIASGGGHRCAMRDSGAVECWGFGAGLPAIDSSNDVAGPIGGAVGSTCLLYQPASNERFQCELEHGYLSALGFTKVNSAEFVQQFGSMKQRNIWVSGGRTDLPDGGSIDAAAIYTAIDPDDPSARLLAQIPVGTRILHENPGGDRYELMTKLPAGASPQNGDWEFTRYLLDGTRISLLADSSGYNGGSAPPPTCLDCHEMAERRERTNLLWGIPRSVVP